MIRKFIDRLLGKAPATDDGLPAGVSAFSQDIRRPASGAGNFSRASIKSKLASGQALFLGLLCLLWHRAVKKASQLGLGCF